jgi:hypothetical protein
MKKKGVSLRTAKKQVKEFEKLPKYRHCYFQINKLDDGSYEVTYTNPGEGLPW